MYYSFDLGRVLTPLQPTLPKAHIWIHLVTVSQLALRHHAMATP
jgi:hypothetical protein